jgi:hypothetical protein
MSDPSSFGIKEWTTIIAIVLGPILAVQAQKLIEAFREKKIRRQTIFKTLMSTRGERLSREHVKALNMIDIEFYGRRIFGTGYQNKREKAVTDAWKNYNAALSEKAQYGSLELWFKKCDERFTRLLYEMSQALGYGYDEVQIQRDCYRPEAHGNIESAQLAVLNGWEKIVTGKMSLPMAVTSLPGMAEAEAKPDKKVT